MIKKLNSQAALECGCFTFFAFLLLYLTASGKYLFYVTPKMAPYLYFTSAIMLIWAASRLPLLFRPQHRIRAAHCLVLVVPALFLLLPHSTVSAIQASDYTAGKLTNASVSATSDSAINPEASDNLQSNSEDSNSAAVPETSGESSSADADDSAQYDNSLIEQYGLKREADGSIQISDPEFYPWILEINTNMRRYEGATVTMKSFVLKDDEWMAQDEFLGARLLMYCCAADLTPCGILCKYEDTSTLQNNAWVTICGVIHVVKFLNEDTPEIIVNKITAADKPEDEYVYPW